MNSFRFSFDGLNLHEIYSAQENRIGKGDFVSIPNGIIVLRGPRLTYYNGSQEQDILIVTSTLFGNIIDARSTKDVFLGMLDGIAHYNGTDIQYLYNFPTANIRGTEIMIFESSVFVLAYDRDKQINIIYRGYLK